MKIILPVLLLIGALFFAKYLIDTGPEAKKRPYIERLPVVETSVLKPKDFTVSLKASGVVRAGTQTNLVAEVSGRILDLSEKFNEGSYFDKNEVLLKIDPANYENALAIARSDVEVNRATLSQVIEEEKSTRRSLELAKRNLKLGRKEVSRLRKLWQKQLIARSAVDAEEQKVNQLQQRLEESQGKLNTYKSRKLAIQAKINAALSRQKQEQLNLSRTIIKTPYPGRVLDKKVDIGQFVSTGTNLGIIYATDFVYVDLPLSLKQYELLGMPEKFQNKSVNTHTKTYLPDVVFHSTNSRFNSSWQGKIVRTSAALDADSRQITVIARIDKPFVAKDEVAAPVRIGQYLNAKIRGKTFKNVYVIPSVAVRQNREILLLKEGKVNVVPIEVLYNTSKDTIAQTEQDISGEQLIITPLNQAVDGMQVITVEEQQLKQRKQQKMDKTNAKDKQKAQQAVNRLTLSQTQYQTLMTPNALLTRG